jgi:hypothetical protein
MDEIIRLNDGGLDEADVYLNRISNEGNVKEPFTFNVSKAAYDQAVESLEPRIVRAAIAMVKDSVSEYFGHIDTATEMAEEYAEIIVISSKIFAAENDRACKIKHPDVPKHFRIVVPKMNCFDDQAKTAANTIMQSKKWELQLAFLKTAKACGRTNLLTIDREMAQIPVDLVALVRRKTFGFPPASIDNMLVIAKYSYEKQLDNITTTRLLDKNKEREDQQKKDLQISESKRKAQLNLVAKASEKMAVLGNVVDTRIAFYAAQKPNNVHEAARLQGENEQHSVQLAKSFHLNDQSSKARAGQKRKNGPGNQKHQHPQQKTSRVAITLSSGGANFTVTPAKNKNNKGQNKQKKPAKGKGKAPKGKGKKKYKGRKSG